MISVALQKPCKTVRPATKTEQRLVELLCSMVIASTHSKHNQVLGVDELGDWCRETLNECGFECIQLGSSHAVLRKVTEYE